MSPEPTPADLVQAIYAKRFAGIEARRNQVWRVICRIAFQKWIPTGAAVLDLGGGYGEFINNIRAETRYLVDLNPESRQRAQTGVRVLTGTLQQFEPELSGKLDVIFSSNFLEHLPSKDVLLETVRCCRRILSPSGRLILMGPNIRLLASEHWDFLDHHLPLSDRTIEELLKVTGFRVLHQRARFLPYTFRARLPSHPALVAAYLRFPLAQALLGRQFFFVAEKATSEEGPTP
ncbi:MAG: class I SAM-dependent methyltransferase [Verrucomicrobiae bacterium]|nr:class I SAM-dependent methyltransferase [Verrucomicrobiae bacterium]